MITVTGRFITPYKVFDMVVNTEQRNSKRIFEIEKVNKKSVIVRDINDRDYKVKIALNPNASNQFEAY